MYKEDLALNNPQGLMCHKTQPTNHFFIYTLKLFISKIWEKFFLDTMTHVGLFIFRSGDTWISDCYTYVYYWPSG